MITFKMFLVENGTIGAQKGVSLWATATIIANTIDLTSRVEINIHSRLNGGCSTAEFGWGNIGMTREVNTANTFGMSMVVRIMVGDWVMGGMGGTISRSRVGRMVGGMFVGVICTMGKIRFTTWTFEFGRGTISSFGCSVSWGRCRFMVCRFWRWRGIRFRCMVGGNRSRSMVGGNRGRSVVGGDGCRFMVGRCRRNIGSRFMVGRCRRDIGGRSRGMIRFNFRGWGMVRGSGGWGMIKRKRKWCSYSWGGGRGVGRVGRMGWGVSNITTEGVDVGGLVCISFRSFIFFRFFLVSTNLESIVKN